MDTYMGTLHMHVIGVLFITSARGVKTTKQVMLREKNACAYWQQPTLIAEDRQ